MVSAGFAPRVPVRIPRTSIAAGTSARIKTATLKYRFKPPVSTTSANPSPHTSILSGGLRPAGPPYTFARGDPKAPLRSRGSLAAARSRESVPLSEVHPRVHRRHLIPVAIEHERLSGFEITWDAALGRLTPARMID